MMQHNIIKHYTIQVVFTLIRMSVGVYKALLFIIKNVIAALNNIFYICNKNLNLNLKKLLSRI